MIICLTNFVNIRKHQETTFCKHDTKHLIIHLMTFWHFPYCHAVQDFKELVAAAKEAGIKLLMETQRHQKRSPGDLMGELRFDGKTVETNRTESVTHLKVIYDTFMTDDDCGDCNPWKSIGILLVWTPWNGIWLSLVRIDDRSCLNFDVSILDP